jgi:hypothetical protein
MLKTENNGSAPQRMTEALSDYENAVREFSTSAAEFLKHVPLLHQAREAFERATTASTQLREILDRGDETLRLFMTQMQETISSPSAIAALDGTNPESQANQAMKAAGEKADAARA